MTEKLNNFTNEVENGYVRVPVKKEKSFGIIMPNAVTSYSATFAGTETVEIVLSSAQGESVYDLHPVSNGAVVNGEIKREFHLVNYELGKIILTKDLAQRLFQSLKAALGE